MEAPPLNLFLSRWPDCVSQKFCETIDWVLLWGVLLRGGPASPFVGRYSAQVGAIFVRLFWGDLRPSCERAGEREYRLKENHALWYGSLQCEGQNAEVKL